MNVSLTEELEAMVQEKVRSGMYNSASEVIRQALRLLKEQDQLRQMRLEELRKEIALGVAEIDRGEDEPLDVEEFLAKMHAEWKAKH
jgi:antitoxin ParD1/3/4